MTHLRVLVWHFYKPLIAFNLVFSIVCIKSLDKIGMWFIGFTFFAKLVGYAGTILYKQYFSFKTNIYYLNAGYSMRKMYAYVFGLDLFVYLLMVAFFYLARYAFA